MDYKRKPLTSINQLPQQKIKKCDVFAKNIDNLYNKNNELMNFESINDKKDNLENKFSEKINENNEILTKQEKLVEINEDKDSRIIAYNCQPPSNDKETIRSTWSNSKPITVKEVHRYIPDKPERVLDAPKIGDDFYSELLDWSINNKVAIVLDSSVYIWDATRGTTHTIGNKDEIKSIYSLKWSNDGSYLGIGTGKGETQIWDVVKNKKLRTIKVTIDNTLNVDLNKSKDIYNKNLLKIENSKIVDFMNSRIGCLSWNKNILTSAFSNGYLHHNDVRIKDSLIQSIQAHESTICGLKWRNDGEYLATGGNDNTVKVWELKSSVPCMVKTDHSAAVKAIAWCPWQLNLLATGGGLSDKSLRLWNVVTQANLKTIKTKSQITSIIWSNHYSELLTTHGYSTNDINVWKFPTLDCISNIKAHDSRILYSALSPDGQTVATVASDENLKFWSIFKQQSKRTYKSAFTQEISNNTVYKSINYNKKNHFR